MKLFFGKISKSIDLKQISEGYYQAPKASSWFGTLNIGDYCYLIGGDKIQFWRAKEWKVVDGADRLYFEIISTDLSIAVNDFIALSFLKLSKALIILSSRSARNRAFFEIETTQSFSVQELSDPEFYSRTDLFRTINTVDESNIVKGSKNIQLFLKDGSLHLEKASFFDDNVYSLFRDNLKFINQGQKNKDGTLNKIVNALKGQEKVDRSEISLRAFYDAFFCDYTEKLTHFLVGAFWDEHSPQDRTSQFVAESRWANGYDEKFLAEVKSVSVGSNIAIKAAYVKEKKHSVMLIKARGKVVKNHLNGKDLDVDWDNDFIPFEVDFGGYMQTIKGVINKDHIATIWGEEIDSNDIKDMQNDCVKLIKYKKQIILQGPPGTGKTRLAKQIAKQIFIENLKKSISKEDILSVITVGLVISTHTDSKTFEIKKINPDGVKVYPKDAKNEYAISFTDIIECVKDYESTDLVKKHDKKGIGTYIVGLAKYVISKLDVSQCKVIQFHPSYSYEDFVRGIVAKPNSDGDGIIYEAENKVLASFCKDAHQNFLLSNVKAKTIISDIELFKDFTSNLADKITESDEQRWSLTDAVYLFAPDEKRFKYKGDNWIAHAKGLNMKFSELEKILLAGIIERAQIKKLDTLEELTKQHASYFIKVIELFYEYKKTHSSSTTSTIKPTTLRNYVLIIDEINRANLSSVLGELIYALEYRGEEVESLYEVDGSTKMVVPPNLYIIGTMNTADRSVGHIDYAIRRRFAFVDVEPQDLSEALGAEFDQVSYLKVASFFNHDTYLSKEFDAKDVQLGHSYFIDKTVEGGSMQVRLKYEIKPILLEYVKDGILIGDNIVNEIEAL